MNKLDIFYKTKFKKMGQWALTPADSGSWHGQESSDEFRKVFGFGKGLLAIHKVDDTSQHMYVPLSFIDKLSQYIHKLQKSELKGFENKFFPFYELKKLIKKQSPKLVKKDYSKISNQQLAKSYEDIRRWIHKATVYDQFGWLAEDYWNEPMEKILVKKLKLEKNSGAYYKILFTLTKPEEILTTLEEKRAVLEQAYKIKTHKKTIPIAGKILAKKFGWMPVFTYGEPWDSRHYAEELSDLSKKNLKFLQAEYEKLRDYSKIRNREIDQIVKKYKLSKQDLQLFIDFGLALDARNEAEYILSFNSFFLLPIYKEIARRLSLSIKQVRMLEETELTACVRGQKDVNKLLNERRKMFAWGFDEKMEKIIFLNQSEALRIFDFVEKHAQGAVPDNQKAGITASPGKAQGRVSIILTPELNHKVKEGDILITQATTVDYLPAMKRAVAFVTEVGGLTCHAAVVAREFGVPCIVSLKNATKIFKDGDLVEVDANKGIVRKI